MKPLRILQAPIVLIYLPYLYAKGLRELGHKSDYMVFRTSPYEWLLQGEPDINLRCHYNEGMQREKTREIEFLLYAINNYDIFHFHVKYGLLWPSYWLWDECSDFAFLRKMGKKIIISHWGWCDTNKGDTAIPWGRSECDTCVSQKANLCENPIHLRHIECGFKYADAILSCGKANVAYPQILWMNNAVDCCKWRPYAHDEIPERFRLPATKNIRIYHSVANSAKRQDDKGSPAIKAAVERLQQEGFPLEFMFFDKVPNKDLKYYQAQADLVIDQLYAGWHGLTAVECMAVGKPVITYINPEVAKIVPQEHPVINASIETIYDVIKECVSDMDKLRMIGNASREYAIKYHHYTVVAQRLESIYSSLF